MIFVLVAAATNIQAQPGLRLTSRYSGRQKSIPEGTRVVYSSVDLSRPAVISYMKYGPVSGNQTIGGIGILHIVNDSTIQVDSQKILVKNLVAIGVRKKGSVGAGYGLLFGGLTMALAGASDHNEYGRVSDSGTAVAVIGLCIEMSSLIVAANNAAKSTHRWQVEVVH